MKSNKLNNDTALNWLDVCFIAVMVLSLSVIALLLSVYFLAWIDTWEIFPFRFLPQHRLEKVTD